MIHQQSRQAKLYLGLALAGLIGIGVQTPAFAVAPQEGDSITVNAQGLDLRTQAGQDALRHRVVAASRQLCDARFAPNARGSDDFMDCLHDFTRGATPQVRALIGAAEGHAHYVAVDPDR
jgi:UrcA family protein